MNDTTPVVEVEGRSGLSRWLEAHHATSASVWLVVWKRPDPRHVPYGDIVDEVLRFGWIDSLPRKLDATRSLLRLSPRKPASAWSGVNKARVARLEAEGRMTPAGRAAIDAAKANGAWERLDGASALEPPPDLVAALDRAGARATFDGFPLSSRRAILEWIAQAKTAATRDRRIAETASEAAAGRRANQWRGRG